METNSELQRYTMLASFFLPEGILDWFDVVRMEETDNDKPAHELDVLYPKVLHIYLDERDNSSGTFWVYSAICLCAFIFLYRRCPETKGKSLEQLEQELSAN